jgi:hypothetical protein
VRQRKKERRKLGMIVITGLTGNLSGNHWDELVLRRE